MSMKLFIGAMALCACGMTFASDGPEGKWRTEGRCAAEGGWWKRVHVELNGKGEEQPSVKVKEDGSERKGKTARASEMSWQAPEKLALLGLQSAWAGEKRGKDGIESAFNYLGTKEGHSFNLVSWDKIDQEVAFEVMSKEGHFATACRFKSSWEENGHGGKGHKSTAHKKIGHNSFKEAPSSHGGKTEPTEKKEPVSHGH